MTAPRAEAGRFLVLSCAVSWALCAPAVLAGSAPSSPELALVFVSGFGPTLGAIALTAVSEGRSGVARLLGGLCRWRVRPAWWALALLGPLAVALLAVGVTWLVGGPSRATPSVPGGPLAPLLLAGGFLAGLVVGGPLGEEVGWRGYALPRMQRTGRALPSALVLGAVWSLWHLPLFYVLGTVQSFLPPLPFAVAFVSLSVVFSWAYNGSQSLLICVLLHGSVNFSAGVLGVVPTRAGQPVLAFEVFTVLVVLAAVGVAAATGRRLAVGSPAAVDAP